MSTIITADRKTRLIATQIEVDLRRWIQKELLVQKKFKDLVNEETYSSCKALCIKRKKSMDDLVIENQVYDEELLEFISFATSLEILKKNKNFLEVVIENTTIKIILKKEKNIYIGDIAVCYEIIKKRSKKTDFFLEFNKVWVHGLLHLLGYDHMRNQDYYKMSKIEKRILNSI